MITPATGEIRFSDGLHIAAHSPIGELLGGDPAGNKGKSAVRSIPLEVWSRHGLGEHASEFGTFLVEVVTGRARRVQGAFLRHIHPFYEPDTPSDAERRVFHESVIASDLHGHDKFSWGEAFCRLDQTNRDWIAIIYSPFPNAALHKTEIHRVLSAHSSQSRG